MSHPITALTMSLSTRWAGVSLSTVQHSRKRWACRSAYYLVTGKNPDPDAFSEVRGSQLWKLDARAGIRFSHENPDVQALYRTCLKKPLGGKSHHLLHTKHE